MTNPAVAALLVIVGILGLLVFIGLGPVGWIAGGLLVLVVSVAYFRGADAEPTTPDRTNCAQCGSRVDADAETCTYCDAAL